MSRDLASVMMGLHRSRDSAIVQFVLAFENASVAAAKIEISILLLTDAFEVPPPGCTGSLTPDVSVGISLGS